MVDVFVVTLDIFIQRRRDSKQLFTLSSGVVPLQVIHNTLWYIYVFVLNIGRQRVLATFI